MKAGAANEDEVILRSGGAMTETRLPSYDTPSASVPWTIPRREIDAANV